MDIDRIRRARDDRKSDCRSFGSNSQKCSQSRKISIGVMVDSFVKTGPKNTKEDEGSMPIAEKVYSKVNSMGDGRNGEGVKAAIKGKQTEAPENETSPWVSTRSFHQKNTTSETVHYANLTTNLPSGDGMSNKLNGVKAAPTTYSVQFFANKMSALQSDDGKQKNFDEVSCRTEGGKEGTRKGLEEFSFAVQDNFVPEKEVVENKANKTEDRRETLSHSKLDKLSLKMHSYYEFQDCKSDCRSFGSNSQKCSQSRKISIGVMADSFVKTGPKNTKEDEGSMPIVEKVYSKVNSMGDGRNGEGVKAAIKGKQTEAPENETSPWVFTRSFHQKNTTSETVHYANLTTNLPSGDGMSNKLNGVKAAPTTYSVQFFANKMSALQSDDGKQKNFDEVSCRTEGGKEGTRKGLEEFSFAVQDNFVPEKEVVENKANKTEDRRETLRMKLWDILGTVSSPNKQVSQDPEMGVNNLSPEQNIDKKCKSVVKPRQNSDTIETDSESPDHAIRRPVTRSLTRNRAPSKVQTNKLRNLTSSTHTKKYPENIYSFEDGFSGRLDTAVAGGSPKFYRKKRERKGFKTEAHKICFPAKDNAGEIQQATDMNETTRCAEKTSSLGNRKGSFQRFPHENNIEFVERENGIQKKDSHQLSETMKMTVQPRNINHVTTFPQHKGQQEDLSNSSLENIVDPHSDLQSPTFEIRTPTKSISPGSPPKTNHGELDDHSHAHCTFNSFLASKPDYYRTDVGMESSVSLLSCSFQDDAEELEGSPFMKSDPIMEEEDAKNRLSESSSKERDSKSSKDVGTESSDDAEELEGSPFMKSDPIMEEEDAKNRLSESSSKERDSKSSKEGSPINKGRGTESLSPEIGNAWNSKFALRPSKRIRSQENIKFNGFSPISNSPKETEESKGLQGPFGQNQEDGLANAITLFALALERVKSKIKLVTSKKSAEVLMPVAEGIHSQLQNAESQIQRDVGKLTSLGKSKRKRLETEFEEQQEQLKFIYQKFKAEVNQHLEECKSTVEGLDAQEIEFRGVVEKQKTSQRKLLKQLEEAVETQLSDAQRRITAVHNSAREKMLQLKYVVAECLKEGILS